MLSLLAGVLVAACTLSSSITSILAGPSAMATKPKAAKPKASVRGKPWCAPQLTELSDHVCYFDGEKERSDRHTLVIYLHGALSNAPGFPYMQQEGMVFHAKRHGFTVLIPTGPLVADRFHVWPTSEAAEKEQDVLIVKGIDRARALLEKTMHRHFDETFVLGFSNGATYGSSVAMRGLLDVDGYIILAGGSTRVPTAVGAKRVPVFVGVSTGDPMSVGQSRTLAGFLASMDWPHRTEDRHSGHFVDWGFVTNGIAWLRGRGAPRGAPAAGKAKSSRGSFGHREHD